MVVYPLENSLSLKESKAALLPTDNCIVYWSTHQGTHSSDDALVKEWKCSTISSSLISTLPTLPLTSDWGSDPRHKSSEDSIEQTDEGTARGHDEERQYALQAFYHLDGRHLQSSVVGRVLAL